MEGTSDKRVTAVMKYFIVDRIETVVVYVG